MTVQTTLPEGLEKYAESPMFNEQTVPENFTSEHELKDGVWGKLCVIAGSLEYHLADGTPRRYIIAAGGHIVIEPRQGHFVKLARNVKFKVEFYRQAKSVLR